MQIFFIMGGDLSVSCEGLCLLDEPPVQKNVSRDGVGNIQSENQKCPPDGVGKILTSEIVCSIIEPALDSGRPCSEREGTCSPRTNLILWVNKQVQRCFFFSAKLEIHSTSTHLKADLPA